MSVQKVITLAASLNCIKNKVMCGILNQYSPEVYGYADKLAFATIKAKLIPSMATAGKKVENVTNNEIATDLFASNVINIMQDTLSCSSGFIYGAAIGDAIGIATENLSVDECNFHYDRDTLAYTDIIRDQHRVRWRRGDWTVHFDQMVHFHDYIFSNVFRTILYNIVSVLFWQTAF